MVLGIPTLQGAYGSWRASYFGTQKLEDFPTDIAYDITNAPQYIDLTSGGGGMVYAQAIVGQPIVANDRCYYASLCTSVVLQCDEEFGSSDTRPEQWIEDFRSWIDPENVYGEFGRFQQAAEDGKGPKLSEDVIFYLDGLMALESKLVTAIVGAWLISHCTYRGAGWAGKTSTNMPTRDYTPDQVGQGLLRLAWRWRQFAEKIPNATGNQVYNMDALDALDTMDIIPGATIFANPQFPWANSAAGGSPFPFFTRKLDPLLAPGPLLEWTEWPRDIGVIGTDVGRWMTRAFERGVDRFIFAAQSTNAPSPEETFNYLQDMGFRASYIDDKITIGSQGGNTYKNHFAVFEP